MDNVKHIPRKQVRTLQFDGNCVLRSPVDVVGGVDKEGVHSFRLRGDVEDIVVYSLLRVTQRMVRLRCVLALPQTSRRVVRYRYLFVILHPLRRIVRLEIVFALQRIESRAATWQHSIASLRACLHRAAPETGRLQKPGGSKYQHLRMQGL